MAVYIDLPKAVELVLKALEGKPDGFTYRDQEGAPESACGNYHVVEDEFRPGCLVGTVVNMAGVPFEFMKDCSLRGSDAFELLSAAKREDQISGYSVASLHYLRKVQMSQDDDNSWLQAHTDGLSDVLSMSYGYLEEQEITWLDPYTVLS